MSKKKQLLLILPEIPETTRFMKLLQEEYEILRTDNEDEGLRILADQRETISAVLIDLDTARKTGYAFFQKVNRDVQYAAIPVIAALPRLPIAEELLCLDLGAADIFTPIASGKLLLRRLSNVIRAKDSATFSEIEHMLKTLPSNIYLKDKDGKYVFATHYWRHLNQEGNPHWTIRGKTDLEIRKDRENARKAYESDKALIASGKGTKYIIEIDQDNRLEYLEIIKEPVRNDDGQITGIIALINDVTEQQLLKQKLEERAGTDEMTGLGNRRSLQKHFPALRKEKCLPVCLISTDCNDLKAINDTYGHLVGDEYIRMSAVLFRLTLPETARAFRLGGDEFLIVLPNTDETEGRRLIEEMRRKSALFPIRDRHLSLAFGLSVIKTPSDDPTARMEEADLDMYEDKKNHRRKARE